MSTCCWSLPWTWNPDLFVSLVSFCREAFEIGLEHPWAGTLNFSIGSNGCWCHKQIKEMTMKC